jgi:NAD(P)-dependent dehydrogenase (short-subunit alcohol dehydrogenase family)
MRNGKVALVTGSSTGIGVGVATALAKDGYDIAIHYNNSKTEAEAVEAKIKALGVNTCLLQGDTSDPEVPRRLVRETVEKLGRLDVDVNNAGMTIFEPSREITVEVMDKLYSLNFRGMIIGASEAAKYMVENGIQGSIIFNTSIRGFAPHSTDGIYGGLKAGLNRTIRSFAIDLGRYGIRVNGFSPGVTNVMSPDPEDEKANEFYRNSPRFIPLRRNGYAEDMGDVVSFLASDKASYITGQIICVDGGLSVVGGPENMPDLYDAMDVYDIRDTDPDPKLFFQKVRESVKQQKVTRPRDRR